MKKHTTFQAGGLILEDPILRAEPSLAVGEFVAPKKLSNTEYCLKASDQGKHPHCAAYAMVGRQEAINWMQNHVPEQIPAVPVYEGAKEIDGMPNAKGTTLSAAFKSAQKLGIIPEGVTKRIVSSLREVKFALHSHLVVVAGFRITSDWNNADDETGVIPNDNPNDFIGGHAVLISGNDDYENYVEIPNSWDTDWGKNGVGILSHEQFNRQFMHGVVWY